MDEVFKATSEAESEAGHGAEMAQVRIKAEMIDLDGRTCRRGQVVSVTKSVAVSLLEQDIASPEHSYSNERPFVEKR